MEFKFNKGEQLEAISSVADLNKGDIVTAEQDFSGDGHEMINVRRVSDNQMFRGVFARRFKKAAMELDGFRVGDTVEVIYGGAGVSSQDIGKRAIVVAVNPDGDYYKKLVINGKDFTYRNYDNKTAIDCAIKSVKKVNLIDFSKPVFTSEGTPVEILTTAGRDEKFPVLAYEGKATSPSKFSLDGISSLGVARRNLTNQAPKVEMEGYVNVYKTADGKLEIRAINATREDADGSADGWSARVSCMKIKLVEGQFDA